MKATVFHHLGNITCDNVPDPRIEKDTDVILKSHRHGYLRLRPAYF